MSTPVKFDNNLESSCSTTPETMSPKSTSSSPEFGISDEFLEFEGITIFAPPPAPTYRYSMSLKSEKLRIWLEDCESKKCTTKVNLDDYVNSTNAIPNATASDYYFRELLDGARDDVDNILTTFQRHKGEAFRLEVTVKIQVLKQARVATYAIDMDSNGLMFLGSKMRDLQEEVEKLRNYSKGLQELKLQQEVLDKREGEISELKKEVKELRLAQDTSTIVHKQATTKQGELIMWGTATTGSVRVLIPGTYQVTVIGNYQMSSSSAAIQLLKGNKAIQVVYCGTVQGNSNSTSLVCITTVEKNDQFSVKCPFNLSSTSYLTMIRLGK